MTLIPFSSQTVHTIPPSVAAPKRPRLSACVSDTLAWLLDSTSLPGRLQLLRSSRVRRERLRGLHVFAFETGDLSEGRRRYLVTSYEHFWHTYKQVDAEWKHHYEVILEGVPVKLYFDLEFEREMNACHNGEEMVQMFLAEMEIVFQELYSLPLPRDDLVQLDASTTSKFSQHLIFPSVLFHDLHHVGLFVRYLCYRILHPVVQPSSSTLEVSSQGQNLLIKDKSGSRNVFVDQGVYTKNRNFRLFQSSKLGKTNPLVLTADCPLQEKTDREVFFLSLICNVTVPPPKNVAILTFDSDKYPLPENQHFTQTRTGANSLAPSQTGSSGSPFPELDRFFEEVITMGGAQGRIRQWQYFPDTHTILYAICGDYKYCERIGRHHKSNNVLFVASLPTGMYHQKCMDSECRAVNFRSRDYFLPIKLSAIPEVGLPAVSLSEGDVSNEDDDVFRWVVEEEFDVDGDELLAHVPLDHHEE
ncbi:DNA-directed primase/polymerase protein [Hypsibius exemplaris]|uniref:DNA-directed primase/polymerase protein n=1 Tax=Hypsibius exemplaris TaxID=2072580 RepID=A0A9X6NS82_HYPEX|nr:DNA-directed primase/polymerase protein [Hypsibius exemplaris]